MVDNIKNHSEKDFFETLNNWVEKYVKNGSSKPQAISIVCKKFGFNPYDVINKYYPEIKQKDKQSYSDIKTEEGSFVTLKNDSAQNQYEVININNKDAIVLRNVDNNEEVTASENEIIPVITENKMDKLNEAQYNISINGLETQDAATLSQIFDLAGQAESSGSMTAPLDMQNDMAITPEPMDIDSGLPMDMDNNLNKPTEDINIDIEEPVDDIEFDEELPTDTTYNAYANPEFDTAVVSTDTLTNGSNDGWENSDLNEPSLDEPMDMSTDIETPMGEESIEDMSVDTMMDNGLYNMEESFDYDALIKEALEAINEEETIIPGEELINDEGQLTGQQEEFAEEITEGEEEIQLEEDYNYGTYDFNNLDLYNPMENNEDYNERGIYDSVVTLVDRKGLDYREAMEAYAEWSGLDFNEVEDACLKFEPYEDDFDNEIAETLRIAGIQLDESEEIGTLEESNEDESDEDIESDLDEDDFDNEIAETLRIAGIQLDEEKKVKANIPQPIDDKTLYANRDSKGKANEPEYHEVDTTPFGKESSEGCKKSMTFEAAVNMKKIKSIFETAKSMYNKKEISEWLSLDRRYIEKLIKEGVSYNKANKILNEAKKGL